ncbi:serine/threonine-protein kinase [Enhygromyxa salina]|uniref:Serine/threonine-protein kinase PrkC n=1 Tax=Enhygromyxa salina TaxID=215803 RepID=A0A2S9YVQ7_9BACT|nr:serine/threonine-protein kinase [Enhygromyxa salina]PRQ09170.1 Serine/threonine-protein kinase PrkC [Enhygromyxa salina]
MIPTARELPAVGQTIDDGRFELLAKLGEGGMSGVFRARDHRLGREVALKLLLPRYLGRAEREQRIIHEGEYLARLRDHPNIVELSDCGRLSDQGWPWLSTELLRGEVLDWLLVRNRLEADRIIDIARQVAAALAHCHERGVVHRDTTPGNLFVLETGTVKLFDFSHAGDLAAPRLRAGAPGRLTGVHDTPGTIGYMSPEQAAKAPAEPAMDVYGFGTLLFELITRRNPFRQFADRDEFIRAQREAELEVPRIHAWAYEVPEALAAIVYDCTRRRPADRPVIDEVVVRLAEIGASTRTRSGPGGGRQLRSPATRRRLLALAVGVLVGAGGGFVATTRDTKPLQASTPRVIQAAPQPAPESRSLELPTAPQPEVEPRSTGTAGCDGARAQAHAAFDRRRWREVLEHTARSSCWPSRQARVLLRSTALFNLGRWRECTRLTAEFHDPKIRSLADACEAAAKLDHPETR